MERRIHITIKEIHGQHLQKVDEFKGTPNMCAAIILSKYGSELDMPAAEWLRQNVTGI